MNKGTLWLITLPVILLAILLIYKGIVLNNRVGVVDGAGIGISFIGFELNDSVPNEKVQYYATSFIITGITTLLIGLALMFKLLRLR
ncbi:hypothetical protein E3U55_08175 [Filobacillus milosensis]|uniref:Uncharacterized protein n=1 Tax=Filobacillus milosensis TaxID=94137 RepID=A0A4Y8IN24_9BACI|nr:hypothetical protein [Filobacillus milosensis]TFB21792.1 hypothetical protein E3U55_08175 [Filobacillus milosensis]